MIYSLTARKYIRIILPLAFVVILSIITFYLVSNPFYINKDSYQFLILEKIVKDFNLFKDNNISLPFYNRIGYGYIVWFLKSLIDNDKFILFTNIVLHILTSFTLYRSLIKFKITKSAALLAGFVFLINPITIFLAKSLQNDTLAIFLISLLIYVLSLNLKNIHKIALTIIILTIISTLRIEYLVVLIPIYFYILKDKRIFLTLPASFVINSILFIPFVNGDWFNKQIQLVLSLKNEILFFSIIAILLIIIYKSIVSIRLKVFLAIAFVITVINLFNNFSSNYAVYYLLSNIIIFLLIPFFLFANNLIKDFKFKQNSFYLEFALESFLLFFILYKTFYFQHLSITIFFLCMIVGILAESFISKFIENADIKLKSMLFILVATLFTLLSVESYYILFFNYKEDLSQLVSTNTNEFIFEKKGEITNKNTVIYSNFPESNYYWTDFKTKDLENLKQSALESKYLIIVTFKDFDKNYFQNYKLLDSKKINTSLPYFNYEEGVGVNPGNAYLYLFIQTKQF